MTKKKATKRATKVKKKRAKMIRQTPKTSKKYASYSKPVYKGFWKKENAQKERMRDKRQGHKVSGIIYSPGKKTGHPSMRERYGYLVQYKHKITKWSKPLGK